MEFRTPYIISNSKSRSVWGLIYFDPIFGHP